MSVVYINIINAISTSVRKNSFEESKTYKMNIKRITLGNYLNIILLFP